MDSLTQILLGAAIGHAVIGQKEGKKGAIWGAILGMLPDLDMLPFLWVDSVSSLSIHRSASHSFVIAILVVPILGTVLRRIHSKGKATKQEWVIFVALIFATHIFIDLLTVYGTQVLWPISNYAFSFDSIFIIDPLYTIPLALGLLFSLKAKANSITRFRANAIGLIISSIYLTWGMGTKLHVHSSFRQGMASKGLLVEQLMTAPTPFNSVLWMGLGNQGDSLYASVYSILDKRPPTSFISIPRNTHLLDGHRGDRAVDALLWFTKGWYSVEEKDDMLIISDHRFGRSDIWLGGSGEAMFQWELIPDDDNSYSTFRMINSFPEDPLKDLADMYGRATRDLQP